MKQVRLFHISETPGIEIFVPRPSPSDIKNVSGDVVFAISDRLLHNYLLPRNCPRVTYYAAPDSQQSDIEKFFAQNTVEFIVVVENNWLKAIQETTLYCYEFASENFQLIDEGAGYYVSYKEAKPISVKAISNLPDEFLRTRAALRFAPNLWALADDVVKSSLQYSLIRMRNALPR